MAEQEPAESPKDAPTLPPTVPAGPGLFGRVWGLLVAYHPFLALGAAGMLAIAAWLVYPKDVTVPPPAAETLYIDGLDRLYRTLSPDLTLRSGDPVIEAAAARASLLNLFIFYGETLQDYPWFINPYLLLAESNRLIALYNPDLARDFTTGSIKAYESALYWDERLGNNEEYLLANYGTPEEALPKEVLEERIRRRTNYIKYRIALADITLGKVDEAIPVIQEMINEEKDRERDRTRRTASGIADSLPTRLFELGRQDYLDAPFHLAAALDRQGKYQEAMTEYRVFLRTVDNSPYRVEALRRIAEISSEDGDVYKTIEKDRALSSYLSAATEYDELAASPDATPEERRLARYHAALSYLSVAELEATGPKSWIDKLADSGETAARAVERATGHAWPGRAKALPAALGKLASSTGLWLPDPAGYVSAFGGATLTQVAVDGQSPYAQHLRLQNLAIERFDSVARDGPNDPLGIPARLRAAKVRVETGLFNMAREQFLSLLDSNPPADVIYACRDGLARIAMDENDWMTAKRLLTGGMEKNRPSWLEFKDADWLRLARNLGEPSNRQKPGIYRLLWRLMPQEGRDIAELAAAGRTLGAGYEVRLIQALNTALSKADFFDREDFADLSPHPSALALINADPELLTKDDLVWRNRLLLEEALPYDIAPTAMRETIRYEPFPPAVKLPPSPLLTADEVAGDILRLARGLTKTASGEKNEDERFRLLREAEQTYNFSLENYPTLLGETLPELAAVYDDMARIRDLQGNHQAAMELTARAAGTYMRVNTEAKGAASEPDSLLAAADDYFRVGLLEKAIDTINIFLNQFGYLSRPESELATMVARTQNLLGRCYWMLGDNVKALEAFTANLSRRTPESYKSMYYIGRVMLEEGLWPGGDAALLGDPKDPLPRLDRDGAPIITSSLQAFNHIRQRQGIDPMARPWRWSTFDLGWNYYALADKARRAEMEAAQKNGTEPDSGKWLPLYNQARDILVESLERYPLRKNGQGPGISVRTEPEDYADTMAERFFAEYLLAQTLLILADVESNSHLRPLARAHLENASNPGNYSDALFDPALDRFQIIAAVIRDALGDNSANLFRTRLGDDEGPGYSPKQMRLRLRNAILMLADLYYSAGEEARILPGGAEEAQNFFNRAFQTYQALYDRMGQSDGPQAMVKMGDCLLRMGKDQEAANHYRMAINIAKAQPADTKSDGLLDIGPAYWAAQAEQRLQDMAGA